MATALRNVDVTALLRAVSVDTYVMFTAYKARGWRGLLKPDSLNVHPTAFAASVQEKSKYLFDQQQSLQWLGRSDVPVAFLYAPDLRTPDGSAYLVFSYSYPALAQYPRCSHWDAYAVSASSPEESIKKARHFGLYEFRKTEVTLLENVPSITRKDVFEI